MMDHGENTLRAAIKSLRDTVTPAVDPRDAQATEQLRLTIDFLEFLRTRLYDIHARTRYELRNQIETAEALLEKAVRVSDRAATELGAALAEARNVHQDADAHTVELRAASQRLWGTVRGVVRAAHDAPSELQEAISVLMVQSIEPLVELDSAWYLPFGFEPDPAVIPQLGDLLRAGHPSDVAT
jgi:hypothetical protein